MASLGYDSLDFRHFHAFSTNVDTLSPLHVRGFICVATGGVCIGETSSYSYVTLRNMFFRARIYTNSLNIVCVSK